MRLDHLLSRERRHPRGGRNSEVERTGSGSEGKRRKQERRLSRAEANRTQEKEPEKQEYGKRREGSESDRKAEVGERPTAIESEILLISVSFSGIAKSEYLNEIWGFSSAGRAPALQAGGQRFDPANLHHEG